MSGQKWPLGSEVRRKDLTGGVMLYDASRAGNAAAGWFDPAYWKERNEIEGEARGRSENRRNAAKNKGPRQIARLSKKTEYPYGDSSLPHNSRKMMRI